MRWILTIAFLLPSLVICSGKKSPWKVFPDEKARAAFKKMLTQPSDGKKVTLDRIETLQIDDAHIKSTEGFETLTALKTLSLSYNFIRYVSPIMSLPNLKQLDLSYNDIDSGSAFMNSNTLELLDVSHNHIKYTFTCAFQNLRNLNLSKNYIEQLQTREQCNHMLEAIDISDNPLTSLLPNLTFPSLKVFLANKTFLKDLSPLFVCKTLETLEVEHCSNLKSVEKLFPYNKVTETYTCVFPKLKKLVISEIFLNEKSEKILRDIYDGALEQPITINGKFIKPKRKAEPKKVISFGKQRCNKAAAE